MTDRRPEPSGDPLPDRLAGWFDREVSRAAADLRAAPLGSVRTAAWTGRASSYAPLAAAAVVVIAVVAGLTQLPGVGPGVQPKGSSSPEATLGGTTSSTAVTPGATPPAVSVDSRYPDGIPSSLGGRYVARASNVDSEPDGDGSFLLGGWVFDFSRIVYACVVQLEPAPSFGPVCGTPFLTQNPIMDEQPRVMLDGWTSAIPAGPVVLQVHRHDPRAVTCSPDRRDACENMAVIEGVVWAGDSTTATAPREPTDTFMRLIEADPSLPQATVANVPNRSKLEATPSGQPPRSAPLDVLRTCLAPYPSQAWVVDGASIELVLVFPSTAARESVDQNFLASGFIGTTAEGNGCQVMTDSFFSRRWISVDNVMVAVRVNASGATAAQSALVDAVRQALTRP